MHKKEDRENAFKKQNRGCFHFTRYFSAYLGNWRLPKYSAVISEPSVTRVSQTLSIHMAPSFMKVLWKKALSPKVKWASIYSSPRGTLGRIIRIP